MSKGHFEEIGIYNININPTKTASPPVRKLPFFPGSPGSKVNHVKSSDIFQVKLASRLLPPTQQTAKFLEGLAKR